MTERRTVHENNGSARRPEVDAPENIGRRNHKIKMKRRHQKYVALLAVEISALIIVGLVAFLFFYIKGKYDVMTRQGDIISFEQEDVHVNKEVQEKLKVITEKYTMIMAYGVDARNNTDLLKDANADTDIIVCINNETGEIKLVSVLRDSLLSRTNGKYKKLTDIYAGWGVKESLDTINMNFDLNITKYVTVNWKALVVAINILGGIDLDVTSKEIKQINNFGVEVGKITGYKLTQLDPDEAGYIHLDGTQAVAFARIRNVTLNGEGHDIGRATRQRKVIKAMLEKAKQASLSELNDLLTEVLPLAATNISFSEAIGMATNVGTYHITDNTCFPFEYIDQQNLTTAYVYYNTLSSNVSELHKYLFGTENYTPSSVVDDISAYIDNYRRENP